MVHGRRWCVSFQWSSFFFPFCVSRPQSGLYSNMFLFSSSANFKIIILIDLSIFWKFSVQFRKKSHFKFCRHFWRSLFNLWLNFFHLKTNSSERFFFHHFNYMNANLCKNWLQLLIEWNFIRNCYVEANI